MKDHVTVCTCTYKRPQLLAQLLHSLTLQEGTDQFTFSILVIDNDSGMSAQNVVREQAQKTPVPIAYHMEPVKGIPVARNRAVAESRGTFLAFIDDDEFASPNWLSCLYQAVQKYNVAGALGPVKPHFPVPPPRWIVRAKLFERASFTTGTRLQWPDTRTGNVLLRRSIFAGSDCLFDPRIGHGEDKDFFRRMMGRGHEFIWCDEAVAYEVEPPERLTRSYFLRRALVRGSYYFVRARSKPMQVLKSVVLLGAYAAALPAACLFGQHMAMKFLIAVCNHVGSLLGACGWKLEHA